MARRIGIAMSIGLGTRRSMPGLSALSLAAALAGCASYAPDALPTAGQALRSQPGDLLSIDAQKINRPWLKPQPIDLSLPLTPDALAVLAVLENPDLKAQRAKLGVADAQAFAARLLPDPSFQGSFDKLISGPDAYNGYGAQIGFDLSQLRTARVTRESGEASKRQVRLDLAWAEWQTAGQVRLLGVRVLSLTSQLALAQASAESAERMFAATQRAAARGDVSSGDLDARRQALLDASTKLRTAEQDLAAAKAELNTQLGLSPTMDLKLAPPPEPILPPSAEVLFEQSVDRRLDLQALRAGYQVAEAELHKAVLQQFPNLSLTIAAARDTADNRTIGPQIGFTLPLWNRNRGGIAIASATREQLRAEYTARLFQTRAEIETAVAALAALRRQQDVLRGQLPEIERYAVATQRAAARGDLARATADTALQGARDRQLALLQLDQQIAEQTIALELLSGGPSEGWTQ